MKKRFTKKISLVLIMSVMALSSISTSILLPSPTQAADKLTATQCREKFDGKETRSGDYINSPLQKEYSDSGCADSYCEVSRNGDTSTIKCKSVTDAADADAKAAEVAPLIDLICGKPGSVFDAPKRAVCISEVKSTYEQCQDGKFDVSRTKTEIYGSGSLGAARCFKAQYQGETASANQIKSAIDEGRKESNEIKEKAKDADQSKCEADGKVWEDGKCVEPKDQVSCAIDGIGWIICPTMKFLASMNDVAFGFIADNFLQVDAANLRDNKDLKNAWETFRTLANGAFVIVFLFIIYGQMTGRGN